MTPEEKRRAYNTAWQANKRGNPALLEDYRRQFPFPAKGGRPKDPKSISALIRRAESELNLRIEVPREGEWVVMEGNQQIASMSGRNKASRFVRARVAERVIFFKHGRQVELKEEDVVGKTVHELTREGANK